MITVRWKERDRIGEENAALRQRIAMQENHLLRERATELDAGFSHTIAVAEKNGALTKELEARLQEVAEIKWKLSELQATPKVVRWMKSIFKGK